MKFRHRLGIVFMLDGIWAMVFPPINHFWNMVSAGFMLLGMLLLSID